MSSGSVRNRSVGRDQLQQPANNRENDDATPSADNFNQRPAAKNPWTILGAIFASYLILLLVVYSSFPLMTECERKHVKIPWNIEEAQALGAVLDRYKDAHYWTFYGALALVYIFLQTFAIPGSIFLSIMSGFLFSFWEAMLLICFCSATGATFCYLLSWLVAKGIEQRLLAERIRVWTATVEEQRDNLFNYIVFLRITPILPNWFINIASPFIGIPLITFWMGTFIGVAPPSVLAVQGGSTLNVMTSPTDHISWTSLVVLGLIALGSLIPVLLRHR